MNSIAPELSRPTHPIDLEANDDETNSTKTAQRAIAYLESLENRRVAPDPASIEALAALEEGFPEAPTDPAQVLEMLDEFGSPATVAMTGRRFFGFVIGGSMPVTLAANWLAGAWDQNSGLFNVTPATATPRKDRAALAARALSSAPHRCGAFVTGATVANSTALAAARHAVLNRVGWNVEADGLSARRPSPWWWAKKPTRPFSMRWEWSVWDGAASPECRWTGGRIRPEPAPPAGPTIVCTQAGNVNTGAFDPFREIVERARRPAPGCTWMVLLVCGPTTPFPGPPGRRRAPSQFLGHRRSQVAERAVQLRAGICRDGPALRAAMAITAEYLPTAGALRNPSDYTPELSRRARGVEVWAALRSLGRTGWPN